MTATADLEETDGVGAMRSVEWDACLLELRDAPELVQRFRRATGRPERTICYFAGTPWVEDAMIDFSVAVTTRVALEPQLAQLAGLVVSQDNSCRYCFAETRAFLRLFGMPERRIAQLEQALLTGELDGPEQAALAYARRVSRSNPLAGRDDVAALRTAGFAPLEIRELNAVIGLYLFFNRMATLPALPPEDVEAFPDRWAVRALRPLFAWRLRGVRRRAAPAPLAPEDRAGPFGHVVAGLEGIPVAHALRTAMAGMWASEHLPRRTKALVFALVGRALGCARSEQEGRRLAQDAGLADAAIDRILAHLDAPELDAVERAVLPLARETVRYQPARIQRRARALLEVLSREAFVELVGVAALANLVCRLGSVSEPVP